MLVLDFDVAILKTFGRFSGLVDGAFNGFNLSPEEDVLGVGSDFASVWDSGEGALGLREKLRTSFS